MCTEHSQELAKKPEHELLEVVSKTWQYNEKNVQNRRQEVCNGLKFYDGEVLLGEQTLSILQVGPLQHRQEKPRQFGSFILFQTIRCILLCPKPRSPYNHTYLCDDNSYKVPTAHRQLRIFSTYTAPSIQSLLLANF